MTPIHGAKITTLSPFNYGHLLVPGGVATIPDLIGDRAVAFALCGALGMLSPSLVPPAKDYRGHLAAMPWRTSMFMCAEPRLFPAIARRSDLGIEGGYQDAIRRASASGNFKEYFTIQEVPAGQEFFGIVAGADPFAAAGSDSICLRIGSNRTGMVRIERSSVTDVRLNAATGRLFGRALPVERVVLDEMILTPSMTLDEASRELSRWH